MNGARTFTGTGSLCHLSLGLVRVDVDHVAVEREVYRQLVNVRQLLVLALLPRANKANNNNNNNNNNNPICKAPERQKTSVALVDRNSHAN